MKTCKNHPEVGAIHRCSFCLTDICFSCFHKTLKVYGRKKYGFCSDSCLNDFLQKRKETKRFNRKKSLIYGIGGICGIGVGYLVYDNTTGFKNINPDQILNNFLMFISGGFFIGGCGCLFKFIIALFFGDDPDLIDNLSDHIEG